MKMNGGRLTITKYLATTGGNRGSDRVDNDQQAFSPDKACESLRDQRQSAILVPPVYPLVYEFLIASSDDLSKSFATTRSATVFDL